MDLASIFAFVAGKRLAVVSTVDADGAPEAALVGFALTPARDLVFDTLAGSRKAANLRANPRVALVVGWDDEITVQIEGLAHEPGGSTARLAKDAYFAVWPDGRARESWPGIMYVVVRPLWIRFSAYGAAPACAEYTLARHGG
jgi:pyridoxine/pyridoxamine 5'-phosphate oxidase